MEIILGILLAIVCLAVIGPTNALKIVFSSLLGIIGLLFIGFTIYYLTVAYNIAGAGDKTVARIKQLSIEASK